jgi:hypothetical protein
MGKIFPDMDVYNKYVVYYSETLVLYLTYSIFYLGQNVYIWVFGGLYSIYIYNTWYVTIN